MIVSYCRLFELTNCDYFFSWLLVHSTSNIHIVSCLRSKQKDLTTFVYKTQLSLNSSCSFFHDGLSFYSNVSTFPGHQNFFALNLPHPPPSSKNLSFAYCLHKWWWSHKKFHFSFRTKTTTKLQLSCKQIEENSRRSCLNMTALSIN